MPDIRPHDAKKFFELFPRGGTGDELPLERNALGLVTLQPLPRHEPDPAWRHADRGEVSHQAELMGRKTAPSAVVGVDQSERAHGRENPGNPEENRIGQGEGGRGKQERDGRQVGENREGPAEPIAEAAVAPERLEDARDDPRRSARDDRDSQKAPQDPDSM